MRGRCLGRWVDMYQCPLHPGFGATCMLVATCPSPDLLFDYFHSGQMLPAMLIARRYSLLWGSLHPRRLGICTLGGFLLFQHSGAPPSALSSVHAGRYKTARTDSSHAPWHMGFFLGF